ncbi:MAG: hypothetical protein WED00_08435 [Aquisalimonadaceae bacterium]
MSSEAHSAFKQKAERLAVQGMRADYLSPGPSRAFSLAVMEALEDEVRHMPRTERHPINAGALAERAAGRVEALKSALCSDSALTPCTRRIAVNAAAEVLAVAAYTEGNLLTEEAQHRIRSLQSLRRAMHAAQRAANLAWRDEVQAGIPAYQSFDEHLHREVLEDWDTHFPHADRVAVAQGGFTDWLESLDAGALEEAEGSAAADDERGGFRP